MVQHGLVEVGSASACLSFPDVGETGLECPADEPADESLAARQWYPMVSNTDVTLRPSLALVSK